MEQLVNQTKEIVEEVKQFLPNLIQACELVEPLFYETMTDHSWQQFGEVVQAMDDLYRTLNSIHADLVKAAEYQALAPRIERFNITLSELFQQLNSCVDEEDGVGASDTLKFVLLPLFRQLAIDMGEEEAVKERRFQANLYFLKERFPSAYQEIVETVTENQRYSNAFSRNGSPNISWMDKDGKRRYLYSQYEPEHEASRWVDTITAKVAGKAGVMMYGFGLGYHALAYAKAFPEHQLSIYEPDEQMVLAAMRVIEFESLFTRLNAYDFVVGTKKHQRDRMFYRFLKYMKGEPEIVVLPPYYRLNSSDMDAFSADAQLAILNYVGSVRLYDKFGSEWVSNTLYNLAATLTSPSIKGLKNRFADKTAVIAGAGPSLAEDIELLRRMKNHALIIAAGSTIQSLLHYGVEPHLIVSMDGGEPNYDAFKGLNIQHIPLLYTPMIKYRIIDEQKNNLLHVHLTNDVVTQRIMELTPDDPMFAPNHSVTGTAIQAAIYMGCKEIVFTGQDLSFPGDNFYAPGARHVNKEASDAVLGRATETVENVKGTFNRTNTSMRTTLADIEDLLADHPEVKFTNTSSMGAKIRNADFEPMASVLERMQAFIIENDEVAKQLAQLDKYDVNRAQQIRSRIKEMPEQLKRCQEQLRQIDRCIVQAAELSRTNPNKCLNLFYDIDREWKKVVGSLPFKSLYMLLYRNELNRFERDLPELTKESKMIQKAGLAREIMQPLIRDMLNRTPELMDITAESLRRVEASAGRAGA
ncbi:hypothetical protein DFQ01_10170 [Paenibacillus cellulosilyticus]|uniref:6-hydroxymethylpterin diphosphokinase MptE-like domain-containing protein n=1 Tax=Paenibacillus cellulosilyticus TaxID=375489 RepID=A0A2V2YZ23_9BACL|nr:6-hydroxymethylpterin diphosphokinase MptE-like protein [Paenibacillus cellulosilyticus]PWW08349.1 hypothetical protein DFQ01_10170 [Paenibacillus cellulosilyticus]QKS47947.1 motility associated factor glycosyltransferase family protein [Paenibacillus cellulosilyticus]